MERGLSPAEAAQRTGDSRSRRQARSRSSKLGNITVINDCYNSNPKALEAMVDALAAMPAKRRIVVAGEMLELGPAGEEMHRRCGQHMAQKGIDILIGVRGLAQQMVEARKQRRDTGRICRHSGRSRRVAGPRNPRRRCGAAEGVARSKAGDGFGGSVGRSLSRQQMQAPRSPTADD